MNESEKQFSFTRAAPSKSGRANYQPPISPNDKGQEPMKTNQRAKITACAVSALLVPLLASTLYGQNLKANASEDQPAKAATTTATTNQVARIPKGLQKEALSARKAGKVVFIWRDTTNTETGNRAPFGDMVLTEVHYARLVPSNTTPFKIYTTATVPGRDGRDARSFKSMHGGPPTVGAEGVAGVLLMTKGISIYGEAQAVAVARLVDKDGNEIHDFDKPDPSDLISNELKIPIRFPNY